MSTHTKTFLVVHVPMFAHQEYADIIQWEPSYRTSISLFEPDKNQTFYDRRHQSTFCFIIEFGICLDWYSDKKA